MGRLLHFQKLKIMSVQKLINQYTEKVAFKDKSIDLIKSMISDSRMGNSNSNLDIEDLIHERRNAQRDRQLYFQFIKDLEDLQE